MSFDAFFIDYWLGEMVEIYANGVKVQEFNHHLAKNVI